MTLIESLVCSYLDTVFIASTGAILYIRMFFKYFRFFSLKTKTLFDFLSQIFYHLTNIPNLTLYMLAMKLTGKTFQSIM